MIQETPQADRFKEQLRNSLRDETLNSRAITIGKHDHVYTCGDHDSTVYFIESGQVKLLMLSPEGRECLLAIHASGDIFGELCLECLQITVSSLHFGQLREQRHRVAEAEFLRKTLGCQ